MQMCNFFSLSSSIGIVCLSSSRDWTKILACSTKFANFCQMTFSAETSATLLVVFFVMFLEFKSTYDKTLVIAGVLILKDSSPIYEVSISSITKCTQLNAKLTSFHALHFDGKLSHWAITFNVQNCNSVMDKSISFFCDCHQSWMTNYLTTFKWIVRDEPMSTS